MNYLIALGIVVLLVVIFVQIGKITELAGKLRGEEQAEEDSNNWNARFGLFFMVVFLVGSVWSAIYYAPYMLGYSVYDYASEHAKGIQFAFNLTLFFTGIVFILTQIALFWFAYKYRAEKGRPSVYLAHDNRLEIIWTAIPAFVMSILVVGGLKVWNETMADVSAEDVPMGYYDASIENGYIEVEATGMQFNWLLRHPGADGLIGEKDYKKITAVNPLGQDFADPKNIDDIHLDELVLPKGAKVRVRITSRDVLHNFDLPHFMVKMDAVPGMPTYFVFTPTKTTEEYRNDLSTHPVWNTPYDPEDPEGPKRWEAFEFELACAELCGKGHYSMKKIVKIVTPEEYNEWLAAQEEKSFYLNEVRGKEGDPFLDKKLSLEKKLADRKAEAEAKENAPAPAPVEGDSSSTEVIVPEPDSTTVTPN